MLAEMGYHRQDTTAYRHPDPAVSEPSVMQNALTPEGHVSS